MIQLVDEALCQAFGLYFDLPGVHDVIYAPEDTALRRRQELLKADQVTIPFLSFCKQGDVDIDETRLAGYTFRGVKTLPSDMAANPGVFMSRALPINVPYEAIYWAPAEMFAANNFLQRAIWLRAIPFVLELVVPGEDGMPDQVIHIQNRIDSSVRIEPANTETELYQKGKLRKVRFTWVCENWVFDTTILKRINRFQVAYGSLPGSLSGSPTEAVTFEVRLHGE